MLSARMELEPIPRPSKPKRGQSVVTLPPLVAAKMSLYQATQERGATQVELARRLGCDDRQVRRLLDLERRSLALQVVPGLAAASQAATVPPPFRNSRHSTRD